MRFGIGLCALYLGGRYLTWMHVHDNIHGSAAVVLENMWCNCRSCWWQFLPIFVLWFCSDALLSSVIVCICVLIPYYISALAFLPNILLKRVSQLKEWALPHHWNWKTVIAAIKWICIWTKLPKISLFTSPRWRIPSAVSLSEQDLPDSTCCIPDIWKWVASSAINPSTGLHYTKVMGLLCLAYPLCITLKAVCIRTMTIYTKVIPLFSTSMHCNHFPVWVRGGENRPTVSSYRW